MRDTGKRLRLCVAILLGVCAFFAGWPSAWASEPKPEIVALEKDDPAPFDGDLYPVEDSIRFALTLETCQERAVIDIAHAKSLFEIELNQAKALAANEAFADQERIELLQVELEESQVWYRSPVFVATTTAVVTVAVMLSATLLIQSTAEVYR